MIGTTVAITKMSHRHRHKSGTVDVHSDSVKPKKGGPKIETSSEPHLQNVSTWQMGLRTFGADEPWPLLAGRLDL